MSMWMWDGKRRKIDKKRQLVGSVRVGGDAFLFAHASWIRLGTFLFVYLSPVRLVIAGAAS